LHIDFVDMYSRGEGLGQAGGVSDKGEEALMTPAILFELDTRAGLLARFDPQWSNLKIAVA
jgi:hypothetical protein